MNGLESYAKTWMGSRQIEDDDADTLGYFALAMTFFLLRTKRHGRVDHITQRMVIIFILGNSLL
jgi:hypothetical protein